MVAAAVAVAGAVGLGLVALAGGAGAQPPLPPVTPQDLVTSVLAAKPGPFAGTVTVDNQLGLPALPGMPQAANGTSTVRIWSGGDGKGRVALPSSTGERTIVADGTTVWRWNSEDRTVTKSTEKRDTGNADPTKAAADALAKLQPTSDIRVDGTAEVAGRPAYELVLAPKPSERTLLREVRIAVDSETRMPLRLTVLAQGSSDPVLQAGYTDLTFGPQDASLFTFTPPPGATVTEANSGGSGARAPNAAVVGDGWDAVRVQKITDTKDLDQLKSLGTAVSGPWGSGREISTSVGTAIITDDGRVAVGAVPEQVLTAALAK